MVMASHDIFTAGDWDCSMEVSEFMGSLSFHTYWDGEVGHVSLSVSEVESLISALSGWVKGVKAPG